MNGHKLVLWRTRFKDKISTQAAEKTQLKNKVAIPIIGMVAPDLCIYCRSELYWPLGNIHTVGDRVKAALEEE